MGLMRVSDNDFEQELAHLEKRHFIPATLMLEYRSQHLSKELQSKIRAFLEADLQDLHKWARSLLSDEVDDIRPISVYELDAWQDLEYNISKLSAKRRIEIDCCIKACLYYHFNDNNQIISTKIKSLGDVVFLKRFEGYSEFYPFSNAIKYKDQTFTYQEINKKANALAHQLINNGIKKGDLIGAFLNRTPDWIISILGIWKAGGAFIALDPTIPAGSFKVRAGYVERFNHLINEAALKYVVTDKLLSARISNRPLIYIEDVPIDRIENPSISILPDDLAYVIYTSGSTGKPKGVQILHRGLSACLEAHRECVDLTQNSVMAQYASSGFDAWIAEMLILGIGGTLAIIPDEIRLDSEGLENYSQLHNINVVILTPQLLRKLDPKNFPSWRALFIVGEKFGWEFAAKWMSDNLQVVNGYGLTETTICTTLENLNALSDTKNALTYYRNDTLKPFIPIGSPIVGTNIQLFKPSIDRVQPYQLTKEGEEGEIFISGISLTPGYCGEAKKINDERFVMIDDARYYMTGDKAVCCGNKRYVLIGRYNRVFKFDGKRIDLDGLENIILSHPSVASEGVACIAHEKMDETSILIIFLQPKDPINLPSSESIKEHLQINDIRTVGIPFELYYKKYGFDNDKTANGKKDYKKLSEEYEYNRKSSASILKIQNDVIDNIIHNKLIKLWSGILPKNKEIKLDTNFFEAGGSSVSLMLLLEIIRKEFQIDKRLLTQSLLYDASTIEMQAILIENFLEPMKKNILTRNNNESLKTVYCMPSILGKAEWDYEKMADGIEDHCPSIQLIAFESRDANRMIHSMEGIAIDYVSSILIDYNEKKSNSPILVLGWSSGGCIAVEVVNQLRRCKITTYCFVIDTVSPFVFQQLTPINLAEELFMLSKIIAKKCNLVDFKISVENINNQTSIVSKIEFVFSSLLNLEISQEIRKIIDMARVVRLCEQVYIPAIIPDFCFFRAEDQALKDVVTLNDCLNWPLKESSSVHVIKNTDHFTILLDTSFQNKLVHLILNPEIPKSRHTLIKSSMISFTSNVAIEKNSLSVKMMESQINARSRELRKSIRPKEIKNFFNQLIKGNLEKCSELLDKEKRLVGIQNNIVDLSDRNFNQITALQYALLALDVEMWTLIAKHLSQEEIYHQVQTLLQNKELIFTRFSAYTVLIRYLKALKKYYDNYEVWTEETRADCWCLEVGSAQRDFYAWMIYLMTEDGEDVAWLRKDPGQEFLRDPDEWYMKYWFVNGQKNYLKLGQKPLRNSVGQNHELLDTGFAWARCSLSGSWVTNGYDIGTRGKTASGAIDRHDYEMACKLLADRINALKNFCKQQGCLPLLEPLLDNNYLEFNDYAINNQSSKSSKDTDSSNSSPISAANKKGFWEENKTAQPTSNVVEDADSATENDDAFEKSLTFTNKF